MEDQFCFRPVGCTFTTYDIAPASAMINEGVDLYTVGAVFAHKTAASTQRYAHLATESLRTAIDRIGGKKLR
jgi:hypothetical protein